MSTLIPFIKKDTLNPSNSSANGLELSTNFDITKVKTSTLALKRTQEPGNRDDLARRSLAWRKGIGMCLGARNYSE